MTDNDPAMSTDSMEFAAIMLAFGGKLRRHNPAEICEYYQTKESYLEGEKPKNCGNFHFEFGSVAYQHIADAYADGAAESKFLASLEGVEEQKKQIILAAHSGAVARACREVLEAYEYLRGIARAVPEYAKWEMIKGDGAQVIKFGKYANDELKAEFLNKL